MIRFFYFSCLVFLFSFKIEAQQDLQWYVKNGYGKEATTNDYSIYLTGLNFQIDSVQHPALYANGGIPKNDIFIIYDENNHFNSHGGIDVFRNIGSNCFGYNLQLSFLPKYVYFSNLYETDDPPKRVRFGNGNTIRNPNTLSSFDDPSILGVTNTMSCLSLNQDFVVGKDVTLILNYNSIKDLMKRCTINSSVDLIYDNTIFSTSSVFGNSSPQFAYSMNGITDTPGKIIISLNNTPTYNYFNFRVLDTNKSSGSFTLKSDQCKEVSYPTISESISSTFHDPNYIAVQCVYKDADENAWVKYRIQAYNDGARASRAYINFKTVLPNTVDARTFKICKWNHAGERGCGLSPKLNYHVSGDTSYFNFITVPMAEGTGGGDNPNNCQMAWVEFCVKVKQNYDLETVELQPYYRESIFSNSTYTEIYDITHFYDLCKFSDKKEKNNEQNDKDKGTCHRPISQTCNCNCNQRRRFLGIF